MSWASTEGSTEPYEINSPHLRAESQTARGLTLPSRQPQPIHGQINPGSPADRPPSYSVNTLTNFLGFLTTSTSPSHADIVSHQSSHSEVERNGDPFIAARITQEQDSGSTPQHRSSLQVHEVGSQSLDLDTPEGSDGRISPSPSTIEVLEELFCRYGGPRHDSTEKSDPQSPPEGVVQTSEVGQTKTDVLDHTWPKSPEGMENAPTSIVWEFHRAALQCSLDPGDIDLQYESSWRDQHIFWDMLMSHKAFRGKTLPRKCDAQAWRSGLQDSSQEFERVLLFKVCLHLERSPEQGPILEMHPLELGRSCRLYRRFGSDRFIEMKIILADQRSIGRKGTADESTAQLAQWLVQKQHLFINRCWTAFCIRNVRSKRLGENERPSSLTIRQAYLFAEHGCGLAPDRQDTSSMNCGREVMLDWLLQFERNRARPYMKLFYRIRQGLSSTVPAIQVEESQIHHHKGDVLSPAGEVMNDGIGRISPSLMKKVQDAMNLKSSPSAIQARIGSAKGVWIKDTSSEREGDWIETYHEQRKWDCDWSDAHQRTLEVNTCPTKLQQATLNRQFLLILEDRALDKALLRTTLAKYVSDQITIDVDHFMSAMRRPELLRRWVTEHLSHQTHQGYSTSIPFLGGLPDRTGDVINFLLDGGFNPLKQRFLYDTALQSYKESLLPLQEKMKIRIPQSTNALMVVDFWGVLRHDEVHLAFSSSLNDGTNELFDLDGLEALVSRCPAHLPSDIQKVKAVFKPELRHIKDIIVFSGEGDVSLATKLSGGDFDGDRAWICWDPSLVGNFRPAEIPMKPDFSQTFQENNESVESLTSRSDNGNYVDEMLHRAFDFHLRPSLLGICTDYKDRLGYHYKSISHESVTSLSWLLGELADQEKRGFLFDHGVWNHFKRQVTGSLACLEQLLYNPTQAIHPRHEPCHITDFLKREIDAVVSQKGKDLFDAESGPQHKIAQLPHSFDTDIAGFWNKFVEGIKMASQEQGCVLASLSELEHNLKEDIKSCFEDWRASMYSEGTYFAKVCRIYDRWRRIKPRTTTRLPCTSNALWFLEMKNPALCLHQWDLLKASFTFKMYHSLPSPKFVQQIAGRQLQFIKALSSATSSDLHDGILGNAHHRDFENSPTLVASNMDAILRPSKKSTEAYMEQDIARSPDG